MIGFLQGKVLNLEADNVLLLVNQVGYEILLPATVVASVQNKLSDEFLNLYIYYHQTDRQPKPVLIGFDSAEEKDFFQLFITVDAIGPLKAAKAMEHSVSTIARAIENKDVAFLATLKGIGRRTAQKIVAALHGKAGRFLLAADEAGAGDGVSKTGTPSLPIQKAIDQVVDVLVQQLGHTPSAAKMMVAQALDRDPEIMTPEALFDEVYKGDVDA
ncbi:RuvA [Desulforapulum autotrophicum HRM2]|uniref:Holliday junction branch migration complex subunit RuvA n=1 Tax=Desulforapulum autotrophicum (strain ATCC 43914 / DSM 3382 / VKM B-1955 / HRM2) TaxID=177437 RepID=RUVA_DESAH|nr:Holliday junction branch migration protein RuvA [Desulforapulum autotrophicum]C0QKP5.1 RecName: Full=Holliday junction branch migration complex subunit RuvA [Desulforapulum autotrophicum HRM2]ACN16135.1 RuvA [Desulforapulum autotrophicum HRM2]